MGDDGRSVEVYGDSLRLVGGSVGVDGESLVLTVKVWVSTVEV